eukprot:NODE_2187_length_979_cov_235.943723.p5 GENE.NODE_2187_length_979_cov_235.943723~~NODE_2187_length_979_cov_235.943723.p5  ORF type:complete len:75 (-),score=12.04 NODE_2187_length_979_cov_235.943723:135-359(-)
MIRLRTRACTCSWRGNDAACFAGRVANVRAKEETTSMYCPCGPAIDEPAGLLPPASEEAGICQRRDPMKGDFFL